MSVLAGDILPVVSDSRHANTADLNQPIRISDGEGGGPPPSHPEEKAVVQQVNTNLSSSSSHGGLQWQILKWEGLSLLDIKWQISLHHDKCVGDGVHRCFV